MKCEIVSRYEINFTHQHSLASIVGFGNNVNLENISHEFTLPMDIMEVRIIRVDCNSSVINLFIIIIFLA